MATPELTSVVSSTYGDGLYGILAIDDSTPQLNEVVGSVNQSPYGSSPYGEGYYARGIQAAPSGVIAD